MFKLAKWLEGGPSPNASVVNLDPATESRDLENALKAAEKIMNDDIEGAERELALGDSVFHKLGRGVLWFIKSILGFEQDIMKEAQNQLYEAETGAGHAQSRAHHDSRAFQSEIYDRGAEYALCQAEAQIMSAVVAVLNENLTESLKGFYKVRKAYMTLDSLVQMETAFMKARGVKSLANSRQASRQTSRESLRPPTSASTKTAFATDPFHTTKPAQPSGLSKEIPKVKVGDNSDDSSDEFYDAEADKEAADSRPATGHLSNISNPDSLDPSMAALSVDPTARPMRLGEATRRHTQTLLEDDVGTEFFLNPMDEFIHSGINMCFGMLLLMISVIPPAFSKLLYIIGFHGDREQGLRMLWQATKFANVNGAMASAVLFGWYSVLNGFCDIVPDNNPNNPEDFTGYPHARLQKLLSELKARYPQSQLWLIEQARMQSAERDLSAALEVLSAPQKSQLKQLEALRIFEKSLTSMNSHKYKMCADNFLICVDLNAWSQAMYLYIAGAAHLEASRHAKEADVAEHRRLAEEYLKTAPTRIGKKKMLGRQLPFDTFVMRKVGKWEARAAARRIPFLDAVGVSPLHEMMYMWNGYKKMDHGNLTESLRCLQWSENQPGWAKEDLDEHGTHALLRATALRHLHRNEEAQALLQAKIISQDPGVFQGGSRDDWIPPTAHYEMAANYWMQRQGFRRQPKRGSIAYPAGLDDSANATPSQIVAHDRKLVQQCKYHVEKAKSFGRYELEARIGIKLTAGTGALRKWEAMHPVT